MRGLIFMAFEFGFSRWANSAEVNNAVADTAKLGERYLKQANSTNSSDKMLARKTWQELSSKYWDILFTIVDAQTESMPSELVFDEQEQFFINYGFINDDLTPLKKKSPEILKKKSVPDIFQYMMFSDYIAECWAMIRALPLPKVACGYSFEEKVNALMQQLQAKIAIEMKELKRLLRFGSLQSSEIDALVTDLVKFFMPAMKVQMRVKEYRESPDAVKQAMNQDRFRYTEAERVMFLQLSIAQKNEEEPIGIPECEEFLLLHDEAKNIVKKIIYVQAEPAKQQRMMDRTAKECSQFSDQMMRKELKARIAKKREYMVVPAKLARCDTSPLATPSDMEPMTMDVLSEKILEFSSFDMDMFVVPRVRMYGVPKVILIPGQGWGSYDWGDNSIIIPALPVNDVNKTITYSLASFRWDSDEDRVIKNGYENNIKENRGKSIMELCTSFYKDYFIYLTKEKKGYRVLPRETSKAFVTIFAPRKEENY